MNDILTPEEQQAKYDNLVLAASGALNWTIACQRVYGRAAAGWRVCDARTAAEDLFDLTLAYGPADIYGNARPDINLRSLVGGLMTIIAAGRTK